MQLGTGNRIIIQLNHICTVGFKAFLLMQSEYYYHQNREEKVTSSWMKKCACLLQKRCCWRGIFLDCHGLASHWKKFISLVVVYLHASSLKYRSNFNRFLRSFLAEHSQWDSSKSIFVGTLQIFHPLSEKKLFTATNFWWKCSTFSELFLQMAYLF